MKISAEIKCYHCGYVSGQLVGEANSPMKVEAFKPNPNYKGPMPHQGDPLRCFRCGGPVYLDEVELLTEARETAAGVHRGKVVKRHRMEAA